LSKFKFELNRSGVADLLKGEPMQTILAAYARQVQSRCTAGNVGIEEYKSSVKVKGSRAVATVSPDTAHAKASNLKHNTLIKAMGGGGK